MSIVSAEQARRLAVRAQLLDGSARTVLDTVRTIGFLQIDPISTVAPPQHLVLWSRLGPYDVTELDGLLWRDRKLVEWNAFIWPVEDLPLLLARMRRRRPGATASERMANEILREQASLKRYILRELERNGPLPSRVLREHSAAKRDERHPWWGARNVSLMLQILNDRGVVAVVGREGGSRLWDLAGRWYPDVDRVSLRDADRALAEKRFRALGVRLGRKGWEAHPSISDAPVPDRVTFLSPFDRLIHDRNRAEALFDFFYRLEMSVPKATREYGYYVLPVLVGDRIVGRIEPRFDRRTGELQVLGAWEDTTRAGEALASLGAWLRAKTPQ